MACLASDADAAGAVPLAADVPGAGPAVGVATSQLPVLVAVAVKAALPETVSGLAAGAGAILTSGLTFDGAPDVGRLNAMRGAAPVPRAFATSPRA